MEALMSITVLEQNEDLPDSYPVLRPAVADYVWQRIESYIAWRSTERTVTWIVQGCGEFTVPLKPATMNTIEIWDHVAKAWGDITANAEVSPRGYWLPGKGPYRFTATVGNDDEPPAAVCTAAQRLAAYLAANPGTPGATRRRDEVAGLGLTDTWLEPGWMARAMQNSGAGDLLRPYRRV
jgi:hypothetical protein